MKRQLKVSFWLIALLVILIVYATAKPNDQRNVKFVQHRRTILDVTPFLREKVDDLMSCVFSCLQRALCLSFNMAVNLFENKFDCLLLATDKYNSSDSMKSSNEFNHHSIQTPCEASPCQNGGTCRPLYEMQQYQCGCAAGFHGKNCQQKYHFSRSDSVILSNHSDYEQKLNEYLAPVQVSGKQWKLCFRASEHEFRAPAFHAACDNKGPTVTLVRVGIYVFGGFADKSWNGNAGYVYSNQAFLFSLKNHLNEQYQMFTYRNQDNALWSLQSYGPRFGLGADLLIKDDCTSSFSRLGGTYKPPNGYAYESTEANYLLTGSFTFKCDEYEVFYQK